MEVGRADPSTAPPSHIRALQARSSQCTQVLSDWRRQQEARSPILSHLTHTALPDQPCDVPVAAWGGAAGADSERVPADVLGRLEHVLDMMRGGEEGVKQHMQQLDARLQSYVQGLRGSIREQLWQRVLATVLPPDAASSNQAMHNAAAQTVLGAQELSAVLTVLNDNLSQQLMAAQRETQAAASPTSLGGVDGATQLPDAFVHLVVSVYAKERAAMLLSQDGALLANDHSAARGLVDSLCAAVAGHPSSLSAVLPVLTGLHAAEVAVSGELDSYTSSTQPHLTPPTLQPLDLAAVFLPTEPDLPLQLAAAQQGCDLAACTPHPTHCSSHPVFGPAESAAGSLLPCPPDVRQQFAAACAAAADTCVWEAGACEGQLGLALLWVDLGLRCCGSRDNDVIMAQLQRSLTAEEEHEVRQLQHDCSQAGQQRLRAVEDDNNASAAALKVSIGAKLKHLQSAVQSALDCMCPSQSSSPSFAAAVDAIAEARLTAPSDNQVRTLFAAATRANTAHTALQATLGQACPSSASAALSWLSTVLVRGAQMLHAAAASMRLTQAAQPSCARITAAAKDLEHALGTSLPRLSTTAMSQDSQPSLVADEANQVLSAVSAAMQACVEGAALSSLRRAQCHVVRSVMACCRYCLILHPTSASTLQPCLDHAQDQAANHLGCSDDLPTQLDQAALYQLISTTLASARPAMQAALRNLHQAATHQYDGTPQAVLEAVAAAHGSLGLQFLQPSFVVAEAHRFLAALGGSALAAAESGRGITVPELQSVSACVEAFTCVAALDVAQPMQGIVPAAFAPDSLVHSLMRASTTLQRCLQSSERAQLQDPLKHLGLRCALLQKEVLRACVVTAREHAMQSVQAAQAAHAADLGHNPGTLWDVSGPAGPQPNLGAIRLSDMQHLPHLLALLRQAAPDSTWQEMVGDASPKVGGCVAL